MAEGPNPDRQARPSRLAWAVVIIGVAAAAVGLEWLAVLLPDQPWAPIARAVAIGLIIGLVIAALRRRG